MHFPEIRSIRLGNPELITTKNAVGKKSLQLTQHVAENKAQFGQIPSVVGGLIKHFLFPFLKQFDRLFALVLEIFNEEAKVLVAVEHENLVLILGVNESQVLVGIWQDVENERRRVFQVHL